MPHPPLSRHAWRAALALVSSMAAACGGDPKPPPTPDPPQVSLTVIDGNVAGLSIKMNVTVSGCETVKSLTLYDREAPLKSVSAGAGTTEVELLASEIPYATVGLAANLSLKAEVVCSDDRKNTSMPQPATFFPVARVQDEPRPGEAFVSPLVIDGSGTNASFIGCGKPSTGVNTLYRVGSNREVTSRAMPTPCTPDTVITERSTNGKRWVWTPGFTAFALDSTTFTITAQSPTDLKLEALTALSNGDALIRTSGGTVLRLSHEAADGSGGARQLWEYNPEVADSPLGPLWLRGSDNTVLLPLFAPFPDNRAELYVDELDATTGAFRVRRTLRSIPYSEDAVPVPAGTFNEDGTTIFVGYQLDNNQGQVVACAANVDGCQGLASRWTSSPVVNTHIRQLMTYSGGTRLLVVGAKRTWVLDTTTGAIRNRGNTSVDANGALEVHRVVRGLASTADLFLLNGPARPVGGNPTLPVEIVGMDAASNGEVRELFRYQVPVSMGANVDDEGRLWLRTGGKIAQGLTTSQYRRYRP